MNQKNKTILTTTIILLFAFSAITTLTVTASTPPKLSIVFDDGKISQYTYAYPILKERGLHATFYIISDNVRDLTGLSKHMSYAELKELQNNGNEIASHGKTHGYFVGRTASWLRSEYSLSKQSLENQGLNIENFAFPFGESDALANQIATEYYDTARTGYNYPCAMSTPYPSILLAAAGESNGDALTRLKGMVNTLSVNTWSVFFFHKVEPGITSASGQISTTDFASLLDYALAKGVNICTVKEAISGYVKPTITPQPTATPTQAPMPTVTPTSLPAPLQTPRPTITPTSIPNTINLLNDPSIEDSSTGWKYYNTQLMCAYPKISSTAHTGSKSLQISMTYNPYTFSQQSALWYQTVNSVSTGETYNLNCWYNSNVQSTMLLIAYNGRSQASYTFLHLPSSNGVWVQSGDLSLTVPVGATSLRVDGRLFNGHGSGYVLFDDFSLTLES